MPSRSRISRRSLPSQLLLRVPLLSTSHSNTICSCPWVRSAPAAQHLPIPPTPTRHHAHACATRSAPPTNHSCAATAHACCLTRAPGPLRASLLTPSYSPPPGSRTYCARTRPARHCSLGVARIQHIRAATLRASPQRRLVRVPLTHQCYASRASRVHTRACAFLLARTSGHAHAAPPPAEPLTRVPPTASPTPSAFASHLACVSLPGRLCLVWAARLSVRAAIAAHA
jgi:hypothetical protein